MKTEKFEDIIRKKLESIEPEFQEKDWANFKAYSGAAKSPFLKNIFTKTVFNAVASIAAAGIIFFAGNQYFVNKTLEKKIEVLEQAIGNKNIIERSDDQISKSIKNNVKKDENTLQNNSLNNTKEQLNSSGKSIENEFVYVEKTNNFKQIEGTNEVNSTTNEKELLTNRNNISEKNLIKSAGKNNSDFSIKDENIEISNVIVSNKNNSRYLGNKYSKSTKNHFTKNVITDLSSNNYNARNSKFGGSDISGNIKNELSNHTAENNIETINSNLANNSNLATLNYLKNKGFKIDSSRKMRRDFNKKDFAYYKEELNTGPKKLSFTLADAYLRTGISGIAGIGNIGYGVNAELFLDQRLSISAGGKISQVKGAEYLTDLHFFQKNKQNLTDKYHLEGPHFKRILNIKETNKIVSIPVRFNYNHPLANGLKLIASVGSDLDLKVKKTVNFDDDRTGFFVLNPNPPRPEFEKNIVIQPTENKLFNNVVLSMGAEKRFGKFGAQAKLFDTIKVKDTNYRISKNQFGGEIGLYYSL